MDLRDQFAVHIAAALVGALTDPELIAQRAYDLAEAMIAERDRRIDLDEQRAIASEPSDEASEPPPLEYHAALLDEPAPIHEDEDDEPPYDPTWDLEPAVTPDVSRLHAEAADKSRPGLARTQAEPSAEAVDEARQQRSA
jgi:hypothetical protein